MAKPRKAPKHRSVEFAEAASLRMKQYWKDRKAKEQGILTSEQMQEKILDKLQSQKQASDVTANPSGLHTAFAVNESPIVLGPPPTFDNPAWRPLTQMLADLETFDPDKAVHMLPADWKLILTALLDALQ